MTKVFASLLLLVFFNFCENKTKEKIEIENQCKEDSIRPLIESVNKGIIIMPESRIEE